MSADRDIAKLIDEIVRKARTASRAMSIMDTDRKNRALLAMAGSFRGNRDKIRKENLKDLKAGESAGLSQAMLDRLTLTDDRIEGMAQSLEKVALLDDPVGEITGAKILPNGIKLGQMRSPIGVIGIIYESRPNVTADAGCLCMKAGNAVILRGGKEAIHSNRAIADLMIDAALQTRLPEGCIQLIPVTDRSAVQEMLGRNDCIDLIIPRGGRNLIEMIMKSSRIPVIKHLDGNCFVYIDKSANPLMAVTLTLNSKTQRTGVCNAAESLLIHQDIAETLGTEVVRSLIEKGVEVRGDETICRLVPECSRANDADWDTEYLDMAITAGVTESAESAVDFINRHGSHHTDMIVTDDYQSAMDFLLAVDSSCVFVNASTRFSDGGQFGMGCEIGISTDKLHARGPMGLKELTTLKFTAMGSGQILES
jgi:glutamate-5-semialdehyde dehydrogenase